MKQRRFTRVLVDFEVDLCFEGDVEIRGRLRDLSINGIFVETDYAPAIGAPCLVVLFPRGRENPIVLEVEGTVAHHTGGGLGIGLEGMTGPAFEQLVEIVVSYCENPTLVDFDTEGELGVA